MSKDNEDDLLKKIHKYSSNHREMVLTSPFCGCFSCQDSFILPRNIKKWVDKGNTAVCPRCGVDAILPGLGLGVSITEGFLTQMYNYWFKNPVPNTDGK